MLCLLYAKDLYPDVQSLFKYHQYFTTFLLLSIDQSSLSVTDIAHPLRGIHTGPFSQGNTAEIASVVTYLLFDSPSHRDLVLFIPREIANAVFFVQFVPILFRQVSLPTPTPFLVIVVIIVLVPQKLMVLSDDVNVTFIFTAVSREIGITASVIHEVVVDEFLMTVVAVEREEVHPMTNVFI